MFQLIKKMVRQIQHAAWNEWLLSSCLISSFQNFWKLKFENFTQGLKTHWNFDESCCSRFSWNFMVILNIIKHEYHKNDLLLYISVQTTCQAQIKGMNQNILNDESSKLCLNSVTYRICNTESELSNVVFCTYIHPPRHGISASLVYCKQTSGTFT